VAKKKIEEKEDDKREYYLKQIEKEYGDVLFSANTIKDTPRQLLDFGPAINLGLGGGINSGSTLILSSAPKSGKTTLALELASRAQRDYNTKVFMIDIECRFDAIHLNSVARLDLGGVTVIRSTRNKILTAEDYLTICENILKNERDSIIILDSTSALATSGEMDNPLTSQYRSQNPKLLASWCRRIHPLMPAHNNTLVLINHMIASQSMYSPAFIEDSGVAIRFLGGSHLRLKSVKKWLDSDNKIIGQAVEMTVVFSSSGPPGQMVTSYIKYGFGIDDAYETYQIALSLGIIEKAGSWFKYDDMKIQGDTNFYQYLVDNPDVQKKIYEEVRGILS